MHTRIRAAAEMLVLLITVVVLILVIVESLTPDHEEEPPLITISALGQRAGIWHELESGRPRSPEDEWRIA